MAATADSSLSSSTRAATAVAAMTHSSSSFPSPWSQIVRNNTAVNNSNHHEPPLPPPLQVPSPTASPSPSQPLPSATEQLNSPSPTQSPPPPPPPLEKAVLAAESSSGNNGNAAAAAATAKQRRTAWNVPVPPTSETGEGSHLIGDDVAWPTLSGSTRGGGAPRPSSSRLDAASSSRSVAEGLDSSSQGSFVSNSPKKPTSYANSSHNITTNHLGPGRHRVNRRGGAGSGNNNNNGNNNNGSLPAQTGFPRAIPSPPPLPPPFPAFPVHPNAYFVPPPPPPPPPQPEFPIRERPFRGNNWDNRPAGGFVSQPHMMNDQRTSRRGRGDGSSHNSYGNRRDQDRGNYTPARDAHVQPQRGASRGFVRPSPPPTAPPVFLVPPPVRSFGSPMGFSDMPSQFYVPSMPMEPFRGVPFITHAPPPPVFIPQEPPLRVRIVKQIDYYFSDENLFKDNYLKSKMDDEGWVPISLIARFPRVKIDFKMGPIYCLEKVLSTISFNSVDMVEVDCEENFRKVMHLTTDAHLVLDSLRASTIVEVQGDKVRRRNEWWKWICAPVPLSAEAGVPSSGGSNNDELVDSLQQMTMEEGTGNNSSINSNEHLLSENVNGRDMELVGRHNLPNNNSVDVASSNQL